jgi:hypothetical protein
VSEVALKEIVDVTGALASVRVGLYPQSVRKVQFFRETVICNGSAGVAQRCTRVAAAAVISNAWCQSTDPGHPQLAELGEQLAASLMPELTHMLGEPVQAYGKAVIIGTGGTTEQGAALIHPKLGGPVRSAIGGGTAVIPSNSKIGVAGTLIDIPLGHKDDAWSFAHIDTLTLFVSDAPRADEFVLFVSLSSGARPFAVVAAKTVPGGT